ncbi:transcriptional regulator [Cryobacterium sp. Y82]|uniref:transcriptional regulator n=1 Tax=Cryobacterium sp. Y82 TaxID=2045017 RepID=UPI0011B012E5|nr:transcriptional regulator [Cryobacterium sp. Y82]
MRLQRSRTEIVGTIRIKLWLRAYRGPKSNPFHFPVKTPRKATEVSDPTLSKHLRILEAAGYVDIIKGIVDSRPRTRVQLTESGRGAFRGHVAFLRTITGAINAEP